MSDLHINGRTLEDCEKLADSLADQGERLREVVDTIRHLVAHIRWTEADLKEQSRLVRGLLAEMSEVA